MDAALGLDAKDPVVLAQDPRHLQIARNGGAVTVEGVDEEGAAAPGCLAITLHRVVTVDRVLENDVPTVRKKTPGQLGTLAAHDARADHHASHIELGQLLNRGKQRQPLPAGEGAGLLAPAREYADQFVVLGKSADTRHVDAAEGGSAHDHACSVHNAPSFSGRARSPRHPGRGATVR